MKYIAYFCSNSIMEGHIVEKAFVHQHEEVLYMQKNGAYGLWQCRFLWWCSTVLHVFSQYAELLFVKCYFGVLSGGNCFIMERKWKLVIDSKRCDANKLEQFISELEETQLGKFENREVIFDEKDEKKIHALLEKYYLS